MANLSEAKARFLEAREETDRLEMYEGRSTKRGADVRQRENDAARYYISALEEHIAIHENAGTMPKHRAGDPSR